MVKLNIRLIQSDPTPAAEQTPPPTPAADSPSPKPAAGPPPKAKAPTGSPPSKAPTASPPPQAPAPPPPPAIDLNQGPLGTGALFGEAQALFAFLGAVSGLGLGSPRCRRDPREGLLWAELPARDAQLAELARAAGGRAFHGREAHWATAPFGLAADGNLRPPYLDPSAWPLLEQAQLLALLPLRPAPAPPLTQAMVFSHGVLAHWIVRRALALGLDCRGQSARWHLTTGTRTGIWLELRAPSGPLPPALLSRFARLPHTLVFGPCADLPLYLQLGRQLPLASADTAAWLGLEHTWLLSEAGHGPLQTLDQPRVLAPTPPARCAPPLPGGGGEVAQPQPPSPRLLPFPAARAVAALLLDDQQLAWLVPLLRGRPACAELFLIPGPGRHLLLANSALPSLPLGTPLYHLGPGPLYLELGQALQPPLPAEARRQCYHLDGAAAVVLTRAGAWHFELAQLVPAWTLWITAPPAPRQGLSPAGAALLRQLDQAQQRFPINEFMTKARQLHPELAPARDLTTQRRAAVVARSDGRLSEAAQLLEQAGDYGAAARLYEQAAREAARRPK